MLHPVLSAGDQRPPWAGHSGSAPHAGRGVGVPPPPRRGEPTCPPINHEAPGRQRARPAPGTAGAACARRPRALRRRQPRVSPLVGPAPPRPRQRHPRQPAHPASAAPASARSVQVVDPLWSSTCIAEQWDMAGREEPGGSSWAAEGNHAGLWATTGTVGKSGLWTSIRRCGGSRPRSLHAPSESQPGQRAGQPRCPRRGPGRSVHDSSGTRGRVALRCNSATALRRSMDVSPSGRLPDGTDAR